MTLLRSLLVYALALTVVLGKAQGLQCAVGSEALPGSNRCELCSAGKYGNVDKDTGQSKCVVCPRGRWGNDIGGVDLSSGCRHRLEGYGFRPQEEPALYRYAADLAVSAFHCECEDDGVPLASQDSHWTIVQLSQTFRSADNISASALVPPRALVELSPWTFALVGGHQTGFIAVVNFTRGREGGIDVGGPSAVLESYMHTLPEVTAYKMPSGFSAIFQENHGSSYTKRRRLESLVEVSHSGISTMTFNGECGVHQGEVDKNREGCGYYGEVTLFTANGASWPSAATVPKHSNSLFVGYSTLPSKIVRF